MAQGPQRLSFHGPAGPLEGLVRRAVAPVARAVISHPHPRFGGTMHNPVVFHTDRVLARAGLTTLRFNFRGVGDSYGVYDQGEGEVEDVGSAVRWLRENTAPSPLILVGYSFGSWCSIRYALGDAAVVGIIAIGLPIRIFAMEEAILGLRRPIYVVQGSDDQFGSLDRVNALLERAAPPGELFVVSGAEHLFVDRALEVASGVAQSARAILAGHGGRNGE